MTAADESQRTVFEKQIEIKLSKNELPKAAEYIVVCDPPGYKIGMRIRFSMVIVV